MEHDLSASECVQEMRKRIFDETNLTASAGIAPNMVRHLLIGLLR
jgi:DNA polymerase kappa